MNRPYIICHMTTSIDGKATGDFLNLPECVAATDIYYELNRWYRADAFACGRITMESSFTGGWYPDLSAFHNIDVPEGDYIADAEAKFFAVAFDRRGRLGWKGPRIIDEDPGYGNAHIIEVLCKDAPKAYLAYLRSIGVSYIFAGDSEMDLQMAVSKLYTLFGIKKLLLEGGSIINGVFQTENLIDELSLVIAPLTADTTDYPLFGKSSVIPYRLVKHTAYDNGVLWINYKK